MLGPSWLRWVRPMDALRAGSYDMVEVIVVLFQWRGSNVGREMVVVVVVVLVLVMRGPLLLLRKWKCKQTGAGALARIKIVGIFSRVVKNLAGSIKDPISRQTSEIDSALDILLPFKATAMIRNCDQYQSRHIKNG